MANFDSDCHDEEVEDMLADLYVDECIEYVQKYYLKSPRCTSSLTGRAYVAEILNRNPRVFYAEFRMDPNIFRHLCSKLRRLHFLEEDNGIMSVDESVALMLVMLGHNLDQRFVASRFHHSTETIQRRFRRALRAMHRFGNLIIRPDKDIAELPQHLQSNKKYYPWFEKCVGAIDGTHIKAYAPRCKATALRDRKGDLSQAVMCACNFVMRFTYVHAGWEGSANDSRVMQEALGNRKFKFPWPPRGSYYLVDSGHSIGSAFLPPHKAVRYHAQEFQGAARQPQTPQELFNYRHSSLRMVIERCFGVLKARFPILNYMRSYKQSRQQLIVTACCALHNFIRMHNRGDELFHEWEEEPDSDFDFNNVGGDRVGSRGNEEAFNRHAQRVMTRFREQVTAAMWDDLTNDNE